MVEVIAFINDFKTGEYFRKPIIKLEYLDKYKAAGYLIGTAENKFLNSFSKYKSNNYEKEYSYKEINFDVEKIDFIKMNCI